MNRSMMLLLGLACPALVAVATPTPSQDGLTLSPLPTVQTPSDQPAPVVDLAGSAPEEKMSMLEHPISLDKRAIPRPQSDRLGGFIYEPVYTTTGDRVEYRLNNGLGLGLGVGTDAAWAISHSVRLGRGVDLSVFYLRAMGDVSRETGRQTGFEADTVTPQSSAGIRLEWKF